MHWIMGRQDRPDLQAAYSQWEDGYEEFGWDIEDAGDVRSYVLAAREKQYEIQRKEDGPEMEERFWEYKFYQPDQLTVEKADALRDNGYELHDVSIKDVARMIHEYWGPTHE